MSVLFNLRLIDHANVVELGGAAINEAISKSDPKVLLRHLLSIPYRPDEKLIEYRRRRVDSLRKLNAPEVIVASELTALRLATGEAYAPEVLATHSLDQLRNVLGTWGWVGNSYSIGAWQELEWFLHSASGRDDLASELGKPEIGSPDQSIFDKALRGSQLSPLDTKGQPVIRTCGSTDEDCFGYNPPSVVQEISIALDAIDPMSWHLLLPRRKQLLTESTPDLRDCVDEIVTDELDGAGTAFAILKTAYGRARDQGFGAACEYSL